MNQIEFLLRLSENAQDKGDDIAKRHNDERSSHIRELLDLHKMIELAKANVEAELVRFGAVNKAQGPTGLGQLKEAPRDVRSIPHNSAGRDPSQAGRAPTQGTN